MFSLYQKLILKVLLPILLLLQQEEELEKQTNQLSDSIQLLLRYPH